MKRSINNLEVTIKDFRAINDASIALNGITVLTGINASGKSTISKLMYYIISGMREYDSLVVRKLDSELKKYFNALEIMLLSTAGSLEEYKQLSRLFRLYTVDDLYQLPERLSSSFTAVKSHFSSPSFEDEKERYRRMLINTIEGDNSLSFEDALEVLKNVFSKEIRKSEEQIHERPSGLLNEFIDLTFGDRINRKVSIREYGEPLFSEKITAVPIPHYVNRVYYIDTPFSIDNNTYQHWADLNDVLKSPTTSPASSYADLIERKIIKGTARYEVSDGYSRYMFSDHYGNDFALSRAATGIKSFAILQMLLNNNSIDSDTLLILDEPETHLHPQWIIEYARIVVFIHKRVGAKFLISSHNPDMISAIRYIAESENCTDDLEFYLAKKARSSNHQYHFQSTGLNIEPIFKSFNRSYLLLNNYAPQSGE